MVGRLLQWKEGVNLRPSFMTFYRVLDLSEHPDRLNIDDDNAYYLE